MSLNKIKNWLKMNWKGGLLGIIWSIVSWSMFTKANIYREQLFYKIIFAPPHISFWSISHLTRFIDIGGIASLDWLLVFIMMPLTGFLIGAFIQSLIRKYRRK